MVTYSSDSWYGFQDVDNNINVYKYFPEKFRWGGKEGIEKIKTPWRFYGCIHRGKSGEDWITIERYQGMIYFIKNDPSMLYIPLEILLNRDEYIALMPYLQKPRSGAKYIAINTITTRYTYLNP